MDVRVKGRGVRPKAEYSHAELAILDRARKTVADPKGKLVKDYYAVDEMKLTQWGRTSSYWSRSRAFYFQVCNRKMKTLSPRQADWLEEIVLKMQKEPPPGAVKVWTKEQIADLNKLRDGK